MHFSPLIFALLAAVLLLPTNAFALATASSQSPISELSTLWFAVAALVAGGLMFREDSKRS
jgi:hypothetical protein